VPYDVESNSDSGLAPPLSHDPVRVRVIADQHDPSTTVEDRMNRGELIHEVQRRGEFPDSAVALQHAGVVLQVVLVSVSSGERDDVVAQLPAEYIETLLER
jgi:hypothetical protein